MYNINQNVIIMYTLIKICFMFLGVIKVDKIFKIFKVCKSFSIQNPHKPSKSLKTLFKNPQKPS